MGKGGDLSRRFLLGYRSYDYSNTLPTRPGPAGARKKGIVV